METDDQNVYTSTDVVSDNSWQDVYAETSTENADITNSDQWYQSTTLSPSVYQTTNDTVLPYTTTSTPSFYQTTNDTVSPYTTTSTPSFYQTTNGSFPETTTSTPSFYQTTNAPIFPDATTSIPSIYQTTISSSSYQTVYSTSQPGQNYQYGHEQPINNSGKQNINNVYQSGGSGSGLIVVNAKKEKADNSMGNLGGAISESKTEVLFPDDTQPLDSYSYYGALKPKGSEFVPLNTSSETNDKMLDRMLYTPPQLPPNFEFSYYGALRSKGAKFVPLNSSKQPGVDPEKVLDDEVYQRSLDPNMEDPDVPNQIDFTTPAISLKNQYKYNNTPIDVYSQYGALRNKNG